MQKDEIGPLSHAIYKNYLTVYLGDQNVTSERIKLRRKCRVNLYDLSFDSGCLGVTPKT